MRPMAALLSRGDRRIEPASPLPLVGGVMKRVQFGMPSGPELGEEKTSYMPLFMEEGGKTWTKDMGDGGEMKE